MKIDMTMTALMLGIALATGAMAHPPSSTATPVTPTPALSPMMATSKATETSPTATTEVKPTARHAMSHHRVEEIQAALNNAGEAVEVDGLWGPDTRAALDDYQKKNGLRVTGEFDRETARKLTLPSWKA
jgi:peptidoglycan hydrolase-like protein with peptidoglycan-binding domain